MSKTYLLFLSYRERGFVSCYRIGFYTIRLSFQDKVDIHKETGLYFRRISALTKFKGKGYLDESNNVSWDTDITNKYYN